MCGGAILYRVQTVKSHTVSQHFRRSESQIQLTALQESATVFREDVLVALTLSRAGLLRRTGGHMHTTRRALRLAAARAMSGSADKSEAR